MSLHLPTRRAAHAARTSVAKPSSHLQYLLPRTQRRNAWFSGLRWPGQKKNSAAASSPLAKELTKREKERKLADRLTSRTQGSTIFDEEIQGAEGQQTAPKQLAADGTETPQPASTPIAYSKMKEHMERALDPDPRWRVRYQKKKIMQMVRSNGQLSKEERIKQSEKELTSDSQILPTSTKKLVMLSHQIVGKTVDEAITQMRFSKKKMAREVKYQLEEARDMAIASRGMGLGAHNGEVLAKPRKIQTKDGKAIEVRDPTQLYVDQSWVTKGPYRGARIQYHARGRMSMMWRPTTRISIVLKEEKTRIRQHDERVAKEAKKAPWVHLPNRPVTAQRQYYSW
ncbi:ribosomal protein L22/L17 [Xylariaceae sp. FL1651]|nr:ribosomal protein L22/L17 [Xylariaceae sp. FL1651]